MTHQVSMLKAVLAKNVEYLLTGGTINSRGIHTTQEKSGYRKAIQDVLGILDEMPYQQEYHYTISHLVEKK